MKKAFLLLLLLCALLVARTFGALPQGNAAEKSISLLVFYEASYNLDGCGHISRPGVERLVVTGPVTEASLANIIRVRIADELAWTDLPASAVHVIVKSYGPAPEETETETA